MDVVGEDVSQCVCEQYCRPLCVVSGRIKRGEPDTSVNVRLSLEDGCLLPDCDHPKILSDDCITCVGDRMVSVAWGLIRKG